MDRVSDTELAVELTFSGDFDANATLTFTVTAGAIVDYDGNALTAALPVTAMQESLEASTESPLTEATLHGSVITLTLSGGTYESRIIGVPVSVSGIDGVALGRFTSLNRLSDTELTVELTFSGDFDTDTALTFTLGARAISGYNGSALVAEIPVTAVEESLTASTEFPLTEATLQATSPQNVVPLYSAPSHSHLPEGDSSSTDGRSKSFEGVWN